MTREFSESSTCGHQKPAQCETETVKNKNTHLKMCSEDQNFILRRILSGKASLLQRQT